LSTLSKLWLSAVGVIFCALVVATVILPNCFFLTAFTDVSQGLLLVSAVAAFVPLAIHSSGRIRLFWSLMITGLSFWLSYQVLWIGYEVYLRREVPDLFAGDIVLFLNIVPMMAALALRPHVARDEYGGKLGRFDFALLLVWWCYLYVLMVVPWQYVVADVQAYNRNLNLVYLIEKFAFLAGLAASWVSSKGEWRKLYIGLFGMSLSYSAASALANWAIARGTYYSGSIYDIPLTCAMGSLTWIGLRTRAGEPEKVEGGEAAVYSLWVARLSMIAVFSMPLFAVWSLTEDSIPPHVRTFRAVMTLIAAFVLGLMVFFREYLLDRELVYLLGRSRESFENLNRLQSQILQSEKLASVGQLVGGAAHELNNPITAMLGYSDLLSNAELTLQQQILADKIGHDVRRTKSLVASLISFARQSPTAKAPLDLNTLARTAIKLMQPQWQSLNITVKTQFDQELQKVSGDSNQLLQVCLHLLGSCIDAMGEKGKVLTVQTLPEEASAILLFSTASSPQDAEEYAHGLSACRGILQEHGGEISLQRTEPGLMLLRVRIPVMESLAANVAEATAPGRWQSQPSA
jgi:signal transduction histidine kinase